VSDEEEGAGMFRTGDAPPAAAAAIGDIFPCDCGELLKKDRMEVWPFDADAEERRNRLADGVLAESKHRARNSRKVPKNSDFLKLCIMDPDLRFRNLNKELPYRSSCEQTQYRYLVPNNLQKIMIFPFN
jgi:hypothetical protein